MNNFNISDNAKICLLLSGGVDSAVSLHMLCETGFTPDCYYIQIGPKQEKEYDCNSDEDIEMATWLANKYGCTLKIVDLHDVYWNNVTKYTIDKVKNGFTPNPDVMCNKLIKFGSFLDMYGDKYDYVATGHYARAITDTHGFTWLRTTKDAVKDQTDFLCKLSDNQLKKVLFPIGDLTKTEVRRIAEENHLINAKRKDSQGICFLGKLNYNDYIGKFLGTLDGNIVEYETNNIIGKHHGHWFHTIGQRKGLGLGGGPWYVVDKNINTNTVYVSKKLNTAAITTINLVDFTYIPYCDNTVDINGVPITFKIRHSPEHYTGTLKWDGKYFIESDVELVCAPGQFCVIYDSDFDKMIASAEIRIKI